MSKISPIPDIHLQRIQPIPDERTRGNDEADIGTRQVLPIQYIQIDDFLSPDQVDQALHIALENEPKFKASRVLNKEKYVDKQTRQSSVLHHKHYRDFSNFFQKKVLTMLPTIMEQLGRATFEEPKSVIQITAHTDQCFYLTHTDANTPETETREMTYVYYFHRQPKAFSGGELNLYETVATGTHLVPGGQMESIEPRNNSIVLFPSLLLHEVVPVSCPSQKFGDGRFTLNGWLRRQ